MSDFSKFRGSLGGFNRTDVADYIEKLCLTHAAELKERSRRAEELQTQLEETRAQLRETEADRDRLQDQLQEAQDQLQEAQDALEAATAPEPEPEEPEEPEEAEAPEEAPDYPSLELEAYRRAEATERLAARRAEQLKRELTDFLENTTARYQQTGEDIAALAEDLKSGLMRLEENLSELDLLFNETTEHLETLTPAEPLGLG